MASTVSPCPHPMSMGLCSRTQMNYDRLLKNGQEGTLFFACIRAVICWNLFSSISLDDLQWTELLQSPAVENQL